MAVIGGGYMCHVNVFGAQRGWSEFSSTTRAGSIVSLSSSCWCVNNIKWLYLAEDLQPTMGAYKLKTQEMTDATNTLTKTI